MHQGTQSTSLNPPTQRLTHPETLTHIYPEITGYPGGPVNLVLKINLHGVDDVCRDFFLMLFKSPSSLKELYRMTVKATDKLCLRTRTKPAGRCTMDLAH